MISLSSADPKSALESLSKRISSNSYIVFLTGAGVSAESGVPTFRSDDGLWEKFKPEKDSLPPYAAFAAELNLQLMLLNVLYAAGVIWFQPKSR